MTTPDKMNRVIAGIRIVLVLVGLAVAALAVIAVIWIVLRKR
jgi:hypothetical protein